MKEIPILFSTEMVRAILEGRKSTPTRFARRSARIAQSQTAATCAKLTEAIDALIAYAESTPTWATMRSAPSGDDTDRFCVAIANPRSHVEVEAHTPDSLRRRMVQFMEGGFDRHVFAWTALPTYAPSQPVPRPPEGTADHATTRPLGDGWQPMETAPRDGTHLLLANRIDLGLGNHIAVAKWHSADLNRWTDRNGFIVNSPYAWRPLPEPPKPPTGKEAAQC